MENQKKKELFLTAARIASEIEVFQKELNEACTKPCDLKLFNDIIERSLFDFDLIKVNLKHLKP